MTNTKNIKRQALYRVKSDNYSLVDFFNWLSDNDLSDGIETDEMIREYVCDMVQRSVYVSHILQAIEDNTAADFFAMDLGNSMCTPEPIYDKEDLYEAISWRW